MYQSNKSFCIKYANFRLWTISLGLETAQTSLWVTTCIKLAFCKHCEQGIWPTTGIRMQWSYKYCILIAYCELERCKYIQRKPQVNLKLQGSLGWCCRESRCCKEMPGHWEWNPPQLADAQLPAGLCYFYLGKAGNLQQSPFAFFYRVLLLRSAIRGSFSTTSLPEIRQIGKNPK